MKKIPSLFIRDPADMARITREVNPLAEWVLHGEGQATLKRDGTATMFRAGVLHKRYDAKRGKTPPTNFEPCQPDPDPITGHHPGWVPVGDGPEDRWFREALALCGAQEDGTYELCGPKFQTNPERLEAPRFYRHGFEVLLGVPRDYDGLAAWFFFREIEGIVWHADLGRMAKIKRSDFGLPWAVKTPRPGKTRG